MELPISSTQFILLSIITLINLYTFILFYVDKKRAKNHQYRISEKQLLTASFLLGGVGSWLGMRIVRHKTKKPLFKILIPATAILTIAVILGIVVY